MDFTVQASFLVLIIAILLILIIFLRKAQSAHSAETKSVLEAFDKRLDNMEKMIRDEFMRSRTETGNSLKQNREELSGSLKAVGDSLLKQVSDLTLFQKTQLDTLTSTNSQTLNQMRETLENKLRILQEDNSQKLEKIRATVDEKLHDTLEKRLGDSFKQVSERLEQVHKGLGEMQSLAAGVGDLKKVLVNVKARGTLGEIQLENILEQIFAPEQYEKNVAVRPGSGERVEFAIKLPGHNDKTLWLPIDSKFPLEDYQKLLDAYDTADLSLVEETVKQMENRVKQCAKTIKEKYLDPPSTTDFGIMFLPVEGLYAEVLRRPGLFETLMRDYRVALTGPTTLAAFLNSLQMGFRTLAIEKRSSEVWALLGAVKTEFGKFGGMLEKTYKKLQEASNNIESATKKSRTIERKLKDVQELPVVKTEGYFLDVELDPEKEAEI